MEKYEKYERLASLTESLKYLLYDAIDTIDTLGGNLSETENPPCLYCENRNLVQCFECNFCWHGEAEAEKIIDEIEKECAK